MWVRLSVYLCHSAASFTYFGEVLRCPHKRIVTITKVYIARNNIHVELIRFRKNSNFIVIGNFEVGPIVSRLPCLLLCWWRRTFRDMTTSVPYVQAVRTESRRQMSKGRLSTTVTKCMGLLDQCHKTTQLLIFFKFASVDHQEGYISWHQEDGNGSQRSDEESPGEKRTQSNSSKNYCLLVFRANWQHKQFEALRVLEIMIRDLSVRSNR